MKAMLTTSPVPQLWLQQAFAVSNTTGLFVPNCILLNRHQSAVSPETEAQARLQQWLQIQSGISSTHQAPTVALDHGMDLAKIKRRGVDRYAPLDGEDTLVTAIREKKDLRDLDLPLYTLHLRLFSKEGGNLVGVRVTRPQLLWLIREINHEELSSKILRGLILSGLDLEGMNLSKLDLTDAELVGTNLTGASLEGTLLVRAKMAGACLKLAKLLYADCTETDFEGAIFLQARCHDCRFIRSNLSRATLKKVNLCHAIFKEAILRGANLRQARLEGQDLTTCDLEGADFTGARLDSVKMPIGLKLTDAGLASSSFSPKP